MTVPKSSKSIDHWANMVALSGHKGRYKEDYYKAVGKVSSIDVSGYAAEKAKDLIAKKIEEGLLDIADDLCNKKGKFSKFF